MESIQISSSSWHHKFIEFMGFGWKLRWNYLNSCDYINIFLTSVARLMAGAFAFSTLAYILTMNFIVYGIFIHQLYSTSLPLNKILQEASESLPFINQVIFVPQLIVIIFGTAIGIVIGLMACAILVTNFVKERQRKKGKTVRESAIRVKTKMVKKKIAQSAIYQLAKTKHEKICKPVTIV